MIVLPVILPQSVENAQLCSKCGADGVFLIDPIAGAPVGLLIYMRYAKLWPRS